jgi:hypothetical protein
MHGEGGKMQQSDVNDVLAIWGERLFYPKVMRYGAPGKDVRVGRTRIASSENVRAKLRLLVRRAPEVMVKVTGGGRGMGAIKAHMVYISRRGELEMEDEMGGKVQGRDALNDLAQEWTTAGEKIPMHSHRREAFHVMFSMPPDTDGQAVLAAARQVSEAEFASHKFAMVLHEPSFDPRSKRPHVHVIVRAQGRDGRRLSPRKADLARWRQAFADRLIERGIAASATRRQTRGEIQPTKRLVDHHMQRADGGGESLQLGERAAATEAAVREAWRNVAAALSRSESGRDLDLARETLDFVRGMPAVGRREAASRRCGGADRQTDPLRQQSRRDTRDRSR